jgi:hypothetical protein
MWTCRVVTLFAVLSQIQTFRFEPAPVRRRFGWTVSRPGHTSALSHTMSVPGAWLAM